MIPTIGSIAKTYVATQLKNAANTIVPLPQSYLGSRPEYKVFTDTVGPVVFAPQPLDQRGKVVKEGKKLKDILKRKKWEIQ